MPNRTRTARAAAALAVLAAVLLAGTPARAAGAGYVRLAHLSPDTPAVDVYLKSPGGGRDQVFPGVGYGAVSDYLRLPAGTYAVAMRRAGAPATAAPVLTTRVDVAAGGAYTVAGVGRYADLGLRVLRDDLAPPGPGEAKVRVVQASVRAPVLDVTGAGGSIADGVPFATTTAYRRVEPGRWTVRVRPSGGGPSTALPCTLGAGSVYSLLVLDARGGGLTAELHVDADRRGTPPRGGVATGAGGTAPPPHTAPALLLAATAAATAAAGTAVALLRRSRRRIRAA